MTQNTKNALVLSGCVALLCITLISIQFIPDKKENTDMKTDVQIINIIDEPIDKINKIDIINNYGAYSFIKNSNNQLQIQELTNYKTNNNAYDELNDKLKNFIADKIISTEINNLNIYGLESPQAQIIINNVSGSNNSSLLIGNQAPGEIGYYVLQPDKSTIYLVSNDIIAPFLKSKLDYISLSITSPNSTDTPMKNLEYIELTTSSDTSKLIKIIKSTSEKDKNKTIYKITNPLKQNINDTDKHMIESIENINAQKIECIHATQEDINNCQLNNPNLTLKLKYKDKDLITLLINHIDQNDNYFIMVQGEDIIYRVSNENLNFLNIFKDQLTLDGQN